MLRLGSTRQHAGDGLRGSDEQNVAFCRRGEGTMLSVSLSTSAILISLNSFADITSIYHSYRSLTATVFCTAETLQDELLTIKHYCVRHSPQYAALVQCSQASSEKGSSVQQALQASNTAVLVSLYTHCVFSQEDSEPFPAQSHRSLWHSKHSAQPTDRRSAHQPQGCGFCTNGRKDILVDTACYSGLA